MNNYDAAAAVPILRIKRAFSQNLKRILKDRGLRRVDLTQEEFGFDRGTVSRWTSENDNTMPLPDSLEKLCDGLNISPALLYDWRTLPPLYPVSLSWETMQIRRST